MEQPFLIDTHSHINFSAYKDDAEDVIARAEKENIWMTAVGSQIDTSRRAVAFAEKYPHIWAIVGLHPIHLFTSAVDRQEVGEKGDGVAFYSREEQFDSGEYRKLAEHPKTVAIGECGLDWYHVPQGVNVEEFQSRQERVFREQIALAQELNVPLMIHFRDTNPEDPICDRSVHDDVLRILQDTSGGWTMNPPYGVCHCFAGTQDQVQRYLDLGYYISFTGIISFRASKKRLASMEELWSIVRNIPRDKYLVETDCPYLTPEPHRGEKNEPLFVRHVAEKVAELRGESLESVAKQSTENAFRLFRKLGSSLG